MTASSDILQALRDLVDDEDMGTPGFYTPPAGATVGLRYLTAAHDEAIPFFEASARRSGWTAECLLADATPVNGGLVQFKGRSFLVRSVQFDAVRAVALLDLDPFAVASMGDFEVARLPMLGLPLY